MPEQKENAKNFLNQFGIWANLTEIFLVQSTVKESLISVRS